MGRSKELSRCTGTASSTNAANFIDAYAGCIPLSHYEGLPTPCQDNPASNILAGRAYRLAANVGAICWLP
jgi:hypothetical protein